MGVFTDSSRRAAGSGPVQDTRLFQLHTPLGPEVLIGEALDVWEAVGPRPGPALDDAAPGWSDGIEAWALDAAPGPACAGLRLVVHALSTDARLDLDALIGQPALVELLCQDSVDELRPWHGRVISAALLGADGGLARFRLVIEPWLTFLALRSGAFVFQDRTVPEIVDALFSRPLDGGRLAPAWRWDLRDASAYARRSLCVQHHESDLDFVQRLLLEEGLFCWWEHEGDRDGPALGRHTLVLADHNGAFTPNPQRRVRFTRSDATLGADSLTRWRDGAGVAPARVGMLSRDYRGLEARPVRGPVGAAPALPALAQGDAPGPYAYEDLEQGRRLVTRQAEALAAARGLSHGRGPWRRAQAGTVFTLAEHPRHDGSDAARDSFVVLAAQQRTRNNLHADARARLPLLDEVLARPSEGGADGREPEEAPLHEAALLAQPLSRPVRLGAARPAPHGDGGMGLLPRRDVETAPASDAWNQDLLMNPPPLRALPLPDVRLNRAPTAAGVQSAIVTGQGAPVHTDRDARVRVQFHWQRGRGGSHRLPLPASGDNAPATAASSTWVRVGQTQAGVNHGAVFIPRVGQEVLVGFLGGDAERPVVLAGLYNGQGQRDAPGNRIHSGVPHATPCAPPWFAGSARSGPHQGHQHAAVLGGYRSQSLDTSTTGLGGWSQLVPAPRAWPPAAPSRSPAPRAAWRWAHRSRYCWRRRGRR
ncbi:type VI secretion system Vgr family protein [Azohydromonas caseinilytica]|uniref:Type VI secretion system tip protein VgrG n=1 Tax=Azohydromonas caseinilytica TaxID=2728836 RepID=A0A848FAL3_9BURK|nr:type VI secretion system Vgr family protein [Azohydromonas caseinilytica]NML15479.1 type VI secretion system tip protein VgrG [Azohydromonas caseinilytica]